MIDALHAKPHDIASCDVILLTKGGVDFPKKGDKTDYVNSGCSARSQKGD